MRGAFGAQWRPIYTLVGLFLVFDNRWGVSSLGFLVKGSPFSIQIAGGDMGHEKGKLQNLSKVLEKRDGEGQVLVELGAQHLWPWHRGKRIER